MSVGYGRQRGGRPLSPIEVGTLLRNARDQGTSLEECAREVHLDGTGHIGRFLRVLQLPDDLHHLVDWGPSKNSIGFSSAVELVRLPEPEQRTAIRLILAESLGTKEVRQVVQLRMRTSRAIEDCVTEIVGMRPTIDRRYIFVGAVGDAVVEHAIGRLTQAERDSIVARGIDSVGLEAATGRLGIRFFTLVGDQAFERSMNRIGKENIEARLRAYLSESI